MFLRAVIAALALYVGSASPYTSQARPAASQFTLNLTIAPATMAPGIAPTLQAHTRIGSMCTASVLYDDGSRPQTLANSTQHVGQTGIVRWRWSVQTAAPGGIAFVACTFKEQVRTDHIHFTVARAPRLAAVPPAAHRGSQFTVVVSVTPSSMHYDAYPYVQAHTRIGATCTASVLYNDGQAPPAFAGMPQHVGQTGIVRWPWHEETKSDGGSATVTCVSNKGQTRVGLGHFTVTR